MRYLFILLFVGSAYGQSIGYSRTTGKTGPAGLTFRAGNIHYSEVAETVVGSTYALNWTNGLYVLTIAEDVTFSFEGAPDGEGARIDVRVKGDFEVGASGVTAWETGTNRVSTITTNLYVFSLENGEVFGACLTCGGGDPAYLADGTVSAEEFQRLDGVTGDIQTQLDEKADLASPALTGDPTAPTATAGDSDTSVATTAFVAAAVAAGGGSSGITATGNTTDDTLTSLWSYTIPLNSSVSVEALLTGGGSANDVMLKQVGHFVRRDASASLRGTNDVEVIPSDTTMVGGWKLEGDDLHYYVTGTNEPMNWTATISTNLVANAEAAAASYLLENGFEGVGAEGVWSGAGVGYDFDYTTAPLEDLESLRINAAAQQPRVTADFAASGEVWVFMRFKPVSIPSTDAVIGRFLTSGSSARMTITLKSTGALEILPLGGTPQATVATMTAGTTYYVWARYRKSSGANDGYAEIAFSTDESVKPASGDNWNESNDGTQTDDVAKLSLGLASVNTVEYIVDKVRVDDEEIGASPL